MSEPVAPGDAYTSRIAGFPTGLAASVRFRLIDNDGVANDPVFGPASTGIIEDPSGSGSYLFRSTAAATAAPVVSGKYSRGWDRGVGTSLWFDEDLIVTSSVLVPSVPSGTDLVAIEDAREYVLRDAADDSQDSQLYRLIRAYSRAVSNYTRREWMPAADGVTRKFQYDGSGFLSLDPYDLRGLDSIVLYSDLPDVDHRILVAGSSTVEGEYRMLPPNFTAEQTWQSISLPQAGRLGISSIYNNPYPYGPVGMSSPAYFEVAVTGDWGIGTIPEDVALATLIAIDDGYKNPTGFSSGNVGGLEFSEIGEASAGSSERGRNLPVDSRGLLTPYRRGSDVVVA